MLNIPKFKTEREEADWWYDNRQLLEQEFRKKLEAKEPQTASRAKLFLDEQRAKKAADNVDTADLNAVTKALPKSA